MMTRAASRRRAEMESAAESCWRDKAAPVPVIGDALVLAVALLALALF